MNWADRFFGFINEHFNVLILVGLFLAAGGVLIHVVHDQRDATTLNWLEHVSDQILAALLGMMTGYRIAQAQKPSTPPASPDEPTPNPPVLTGGK